MDDITNGLTEAEATFQAAVLALSLPSWKPDESTDAADAKRRRRILKAIALQMEALSF